MSYESNKTESRLLAELNDGRRSLKKCVFLNNFSVIGFICCIIMILSALGIAIFTSIIHFNATTACVWLTTVGVVGFIISLRFSVVTDDWVSNATEKLRQAEEQYELSTMGGNE